MQTSSLRRQVKNMVNNYTEAEIKVREATSNDPWGPPSSLMSEIADLTFNVVAFTEVMGMIWKRLNDHGKNWRHVYKALTLLDYLIKTGSERVAQQCRENIYTIQTLRDFQYTDRDGRDQGVNVREKAKQLVALIRDDERLKQERTQALKTKERMAGAAARMGSGSLPPPYPGRRTSQPSMAALYGDEFSRSRGSPSSFHSSSSSPRLAPDLEQARPQTSGEEELQLQLALAMSREENEKEQRSRQGDESMLRKALEESKREMEAKGGTAFMDLVDVFAVPTDVPPRVNPWSDVQPQAAARMTSTDPWDSLGDGAANMLRVDSPWMAPPTSSSPAPSWERSQSPTDPWDAPQNNIPKLNSTDQAWASPSNAAAASAVDPFSGPAERTAPLSATRAASPRAGSPSDGDLFDEAMDGGQMRVNGRDEGSPELFDLSRLGESLADLSPRTCHTPEAFLGPTGASLVNLDSLIPTNPQVKNKNPFLSGLSAPSPTNPFQTEQPRLTLNQMCSSSNALAPPATSLPYSASLPLPVNHQPASLPSSFTHPSQSRLDMPGNLPQPLLPLSSASTLGTQAEQLSQNPFL
ncbi:epsin-3 isoform X3 [Lampris incognitus]|uniref:epsin-3 isoform X3 n=1 Tax=Lampris incognitus TaxID=2546036 RepID=UPI0024B5E6E5|nr:epsin-3 isoform X3 [Lampris incognitus]